MFLSTFREHLSDKPDGWEELFWIGSELQADCKAYPPFDEVLAYYRRREALAPKRGFS